MRPFHTFRVTPSLPDSLEPLRKLALNLRWAWDHETIQLFRRLDSDLWESSNHNPLLMLGTVSQHSLEKVAGDEGFIAHMNRVYEDFQQYMSGESTWYKGTYKDDRKPLFAYFSAEFGLTECMSIFAGGLGILAGDHLKSASDLGIPLVGVGLLYQQGYFKQYLNEAGWQQEAYADNDFDNLPVTRETDPDGKDRLVKVDYPGRQVYAKIWKAQVGRIPLYLLDTNLRENSGEDRSITHQLYGGDNEIRLRQEIMLGIGGYRMLQSLGIDPMIYHINEGHSAFILLERICHLMDEREIPFPTAYEIASSETVFTTHTPVPAGHDYFSPELMYQYFGNYINRFGISRQQFLALGRSGVSKGSEDFCMTILALRAASFSNGVSRLHGEVSRQMWEGLYPEVPTDEIPILHITNGVHFNSWISLEMKQLYDRYLGPRWREEPADASVWARARHIAPEELWRTHERRKERLVTFSRRRLRAQLEYRGVPQREIEEADDILNPGALTIGFARRFATYKRALLIMRDVDRLERILNNEESPVQIIFAGKAHPRDNPGKEMIQKIVELARKENFRRRLVFLEDYDMAVARYLVQGVDIWLNTPLRTREASGTSGMKATANGVLNVSIPDGWWDEAYTPHSGWAIGRGEIYEDKEYQAQVEAEALYELLERDIIPVFYERTANGLPRLWIEYMKNSIQNLCHYFNTNRMVAEYVDRFYIPAAERFKELVVDAPSKIDELARWKQRVHENWKDVRVLNITSENLDGFQVGDPLTVRTEVNLGALTPKDVTVELYIGNVGPQGEFIEAKAIPMWVGETRNNTYVYEVQDVCCQKSGLHGLTVRILPHHPDLIHPFIPGLLTWAANEQ